MSAPLLGAVRRLRPAADPDADLVRRFAADRDPAAFEALVRRHGPAVLGACLRVLGNTADAEDAFQATFLVLARKAGAVRRPAAVGNWLYGVAVNVSRRARAADHRRRQAERNVVRVAPADAPAESVVDDELSRLPDHYRLALVLCGVEGRTMREAAVALGWPPGTVATRLTRGRKLLAERLARRGVAVPLGLAAAVSEGLVQRAVAAPAAAAISLATEVTRAMLFAKLKVAAAVLAIAGVGAGVMLAQPPKEVAPPPAAAAAGPLPLVERAEVVVIPAGRPHRFVLPAAVAQGSLRVGDEELLAVAHDTTDLGKVVLTGLKPGTSFVTGTSYTGDRPVSVLVVVSRPHLRLTPRVGEEVVVRLPDGRKPAEVRLRKERPLVGLELKSLGGSSVTLDDGKSPRWMNFAADAGPDVLRVKPLGEGANQFTVTDDRGLEWTVAVVVTGAGAKP